MTTEQETATLARRLEELLRGDDLEGALELLQSVHPADQAEIYRRLEEPERGMLLAMLSPEELGELLEHLDEELIREIVEGMPRVSLARVLDHTQNDIAADILRLLPGTEAVRTLAAMSTAAEVMPLVGHEDESAGGIMTRGYVGLHPEMTAGEAMNFLRATKPLAEEAYYLYVVDTDDRLLGVVNLRELIVSEPETNLRDVMTRDVVSVTPEMDQEETARLMRHYRLRAIPVVEDGVLRGVITADDIMDVITEEATEDMYRIAGVLGDERVFSSVKRSIPRRLPWLLLLLVFSSFTAIVVGAFEATIADFAILAAFMPIIAGQAGNSSIQVITLMVRGLALGEVGPRDAFRVIAKEIRVGLINGIVIGFIVGVAGYLVTGRLLLGIILWAALVGNMLIAGIMGVIVPLTVRVLRLDPALGSGPFVTSMADVTGVAIYLGLATIFLTDLV